MKRNTLFTIVLLVVLFVGATAVARAQEPTTLSWDWTIPAVITHNEGGNWLSNPRLLATEDALWATWDEYPDIGVGRSDDGAQWDKRVVEYDPTNPNNGGWFSGTQPLMVTSGEPHSKEELHMMTSGYREDGVGIGLYTAHVFHNGIAFETFGGYSIVGLDTREAGRRFATVVDGDSVYLTWRPAADGVVYYARGERFGTSIYTWSASKMITTELAQGTVPAIWAEGDGIVILVDNTANYPDIWSWAFASTDGGETWSQHFVGSGHVDTIVQSGNKLVALLDRDGSRVLETFVSDDLGQTWDGPYAVPNVTWAEEATLTVDPSSGLLVAVWTDDQTIFASNSFDGMSWSIAETVFPSTSTNVHPDVVVWKGRIFVVWQSGKSILVSSRPAPVRHRILLPLISKSE